MRAILFDLDNTLVDRDGAMHRWLSRHLGAADRAEALALDAGGRGPREPLMTWLAERRPTLGGDGPAVWERFVRELPALVEPETATLDCLEALATRFELAVVTNGGAALQRAKLAAAQLTAPFPEGRVFVSGELGVDKPRPEIYRRALAALGVDARDALFVGDDETNDVAAPGKLGMRTCWVHRGDPSAACPAADLRVAHVSALPAALP